MKWADRAASLALREATIANLGRMSIGEGVRVVGSPVPSHLATGPSGVLRIGDRVRIGHGVSIYAHGEIVIEEDVVIGPFTMIMDVDFHEVKDRESMGSPRPIRIGRGVRLGSGVVVLRGAAIGERTLVAASSVVSRAVPPNCRAAGVPAHAVSVA